MLYLPEEEDDFVDPVYEAEIQLFLSSIFPNWPFYKDFDSVNWMAEGF